MEHGLELTSNTFHLKDMLGPILGEKKQSPQKSHLTCAIYTLPGKNFQIVLRKLRKAVRHNKKDLNLESKTQMFTEVGKESQ